MSVLLHLSCCVLLMQDCVATIPPYPHYFDDRDDGNDVAAALSDPARPVTVCGLFKFVLNRDCSFKFHVLCAY